MCLVVKSYFLGSNRIINRKFSTITSSSANARYSLNRPEYHTQIARHSEFKSYIFLSNDLMWMPLSENNVREGRQWK